MKNIFGVLTVLLGVAIGELEPRDWVAVDESCRPPVPGAANASCAHTGVLWSLDGYGSTTCDWSLSLANCKPMDAVALPSVRSYYFMGNSVSPLIHVRPSPHSQPPRQRCPILLFNGQLGKPADPRLSIATQPATPGMLDLAQPCPPPYSRRSDCRWTTYQYFSATR